MPTIGGVPYFTSGYGTQYPLRVVLYSKAKATDISPLIKSVTISGDIKQAGRRCEIVFHNTANGKHRLVGIGVGMEVRVYYTNDEIFRGILFRDSIEHDGEHSLTCYDYNYYLTQNTDSLTFTKVTASQIVRFICRKYDIPMGGIADTKYVFPRLIFRNKTLYEIIITALTETEKKTGKKYGLFSIAGKLYLREFKSQVTRLVIENKRNLLSARYEESIEETRTQVRVTGGSENNPVSVTVSNKAAIDKYGLMQHYEHYDDVKDKAKLTELANKLLADLSDVSKTIEIEALGLWSVQAGTAVYVREEMTAIQGGFYVIEDSHTVDANGQHTMSLRLSPTLDLERIDYEEPPKEEEERQETKDRGDHKGQIPTVTSGMFMRPCVGRITSGFGKRGSDFHYGVDIAASGLVPIVAAADGVVSRSYYSSTYGEVIMIRHSIGGKTYETVYAHLRRGSRKYQAGQRVKKGAVIGYMGSTGRSTGQHLHFEIHVGTWNVRKSNAVDPLKFID
jgi:murein DD-endopeptidase MepM/ murein hydrolase activator NlpD